MMVSTQLLALTMSCHIGRTGVFERVDEAVAARCVTAPRGAVVAFVAQEVGKGAVEGAANATLKNHVALGQHQLPHLGRARSQALQQLCCPLVATTDRRRAAEGRLVDPA